MRYFISIFLLFFLFQPPLFSQKDISTSPKSPQVLNEEAKSPLNKTITRSIAKENLKKNNKSFLYKKNTSNLADKKIGTAWIFKYIMSLLFILLLMGFLLFAVKKFNTRFGKGKSDNDIRLLGRFPLDQKNTLSIVRIRDKDLVIGCGQNGCNLIASFDSKENSENPFQEESKTFDLEVKKGITKEEKTI